MISVVRCLDERVKVPAFQLQDPTDMPYSPDLVTADDVAAALVELVERKPYLRRPVAGGDIGQGAGSPAGEEMSLLRMFGR